MSCGRIARGSSLDDCDLPQGGTRARLILINFDDITQMYVNDQGKVISIGMQAGTVGYEFLGFRNDVTKSDEVVKREQSKQRFTHAVGFVVYEIGQVQKNNLKQLARGRFVAIVENKGKDEDSIEVLGRECGLQIVDGQIRNAHENGGLFIINLATPDNGVEFERKLPQTLGTSYQDGLDIIDEILGEDVVGTEGFDYVMNFIFTPGSTEQEGLDYELDLIITA